MVKSLRDLSHARTDETLPPPPRLPRAPEGMKQSIIYNSVEALLQLKVLAAEQGTTISALMGEGMNQVFRKYNKPLIAIERPLKGGRDNAE